MVKLEEASIHILTEPEDSQLKTWGPWVKKPRGVNPHDKWSTDYVERQQAIIQQWAFSS